MFFLQVEQAGTLAPRQPEDARNVTSAHLFLSLRMAVPGMRTIKKPRDLTGLYATLRTFSLLADSRFPKVRVRQAASLLPKDRRYKQRKKRQGKNKAERCSQ